MSEDKDLGIFKPIQRRDFIQGVALSSAYLLTACASSSYKFLKPFETKKVAVAFQGQNDEAKALGHCVRDSPREEMEANAYDTHEVYDLVVVGAGISGLASARSFQRERGNVKILILDNGSSFGGHAARNTFTHEGQNYIASGGSYTVEDPHDSPPEAIAILKDIGIEFEDFLRFRTDAYTRIGLSSCLLLDPRYFQTAKLCWKQKFHQGDLHNFFRDTPLPPQDREELIRFYSSTEDYLRNFQNKDQILKNTSWEEFLRSYMKLGNISVDFANLYAPDIFGLGCDAISAYDAKGAGPGFLGMGGDAFKVQDGSISYNYETRYRLPDGNYSIARALVKKLIPEAFPCSQNFEELFTETIQAEHLHKHAVKFRFRSMVASLRHNTQGSVDVVYRSAEGRTYKVRAKHVIMSGWGMLAKRIVAELPDLQKEALQKYNYTSSAYINVFLRNWKPIAAIGADKMYLPKGFCTWMSLSDPIHLKNYTPHYDPNSPTILSMYKYFYKPGLPVKAQTSLSRIELEGKTFYSFEKEIRSELNYIFGPWGFDAARDILGIQINRWGHGYNFFSSTSDPYLDGRRSFGKISFAGADAGGSPWMQNSLAQAWRAVQEQLKA